MTRWFNTAGPCNPEYHYMLPVEARLPPVRRYIDQQAYFVLHAPRLVARRRRREQAITPGGRDVVVVRA
jgi:hypothetical protein